MIFLDSEIKLKFNAVKIKNLTLICLAIMFFSCKQKDLVTLTDYVNPMIGTSAHGHTFPGATVPFGMVQLSPDTHNEGWDWCSGYHYSDSSIMGFSHTHLSGTGRGELLDILLMPTTGEIKFQPGTRENPDEGYRSRFSHQNEIAKAGYYSVILDDYQIKAELTATKRAGFHRYTFSKDEPANLVIDLNHSVKTDLILNGKMEIINDTLIVGSHRSKGWGEEGENFYVEHEVFFAIRLSQPITKASFFVDGNVLENVKSVQGRAVKANLVFDVQKQDPLLVKVGISSVDVNGAINNVDTEIMTWNFEDISRQASSDWNTLLSTFQVNDENQANK